MAEETKFGSSSGVPERMRCGEFDALLADAIDDALAGITLERFQQHATTCGNCGPLLAEARQGLAWLKTLEEVEPPVNLVHNVLAFTSRAASGSAPAVTGKEEKSRWPFLNFAGFPRLRRLLHVPSQPGFAATLGMAFFSVSLLLNVAGFSVSSLRRLDLRPSAVRKLVVQQYYSTSARFVRYYQNTRLVYEVESKLRELRRAAGGGEEQPKPEPKPAPDKTFNQPQYEDPAIGRYRNEENRNRQDLVRGIDTQNSLLSLGGAALAATTPAALAPQDEAEAEAEAEIKSIVRRFV